MFVEKQCLLVQLILEECDLAILVIHEIYIYIWFCAILCLFNKYMDNAKPIQLQGGWGDHGDTD